MTADQSIRGLKAVICIAMAELNLIHKSDLVRPGLTENLSNAIWALSHPLSTGIRGRSAGLAPRGKWVCVFLKGHILPEYRQYRGRQDNNPLSNNGIILYWGNWILTGAWEHHTDNWCKLIFPTFVFWSPKNKSASQHLRLIVSEVRSRILCLWAKNSDTWSCCC